MRASDIKKAEHREMYPNYRFQPLKREEKERIREEKKQLKEKAKEARQRSKTSRTVSGTSSVGGQSCTSASAIAHSQWMPTSDPLAPYMNPSDPRFASSARGTPYSAPDIRSVPNLLKPTQSASSSEVPSDTLDTSSPSESSPHPSIYPPSPELRDAPHLAVPQPSVTANYNEWSQQEVTNLVESMMRQYQPEGDNLSLSQGHDQTVRLHVQSACPTLTT